MNHNPTPARWQVEHLPQAPEHNYFPTPPAGPVLVMRGVCVPEGPPSQRYGHVEDDLDGKTIEVVVQLEITPLTNGIGVWFCEEGSMTWYFQSSHFKNTLLNDPEFDRWVTTALKARKEPTP
jgi:hypothetical protein